jgi:hypothetical protein
MIHTLSTLRHGRSYRGLLPNSYSYSTDALLCDRKDDECWAEKDNTFLTGFKCGTVGSFFHIRP